MKTVVEKRRGIDELFTTGASTATVLRGFLADNRSRLIAIALVICLYIALKKRV